jgi:hypothetical protein
MCASQPFHSNSTVVGIPDADFATTLDKLTGHECDDACDETHDVDPIADTQRPSDLARAEADLHALEADLAAERAGDAVDRATDAVRGGR